MAHYLQAVAGLKLEKGHARVGDIAERLGVSKSGVTSMLRSLSSHGLVSHERYGCVELTDSGSRLAARTETNRKVLAIFFTDILRVPEAVAIENACMIEHLVTPEAMIQFLRLIAFAESGDPAAVRFRDAFRDYQLLCESGQDRGDCVVCEGSCLREAVKEMAADHSTKPERE